MDTASISEMFFSLSEINAKFIFQNSVNCTSLMFNQVLCGCNQQEMISEH